MNAQTEKEMDLLARKKFLVSLLCNQLNRILESLRGGYQRRFSHSKTWSHREWIAEKHGQLAMVNIMCDQLCSDIGTGLADSIPGFHTLANSLAVAEEAVRLLRAKHGMIEGESKKKRRKE